MTLPLAACSPQEAPRTATQLPVPPGSKAAAATGATTDTPSPIPATRTPALPTDDCINDASLVAHLTLPDGSQVPSGAIIEKAWLVSNIGSCPWAEGTLLAFDGGQGGLEGIDVELPEVAPGNTVEISISLVAPQTPGMVEAFWRLRSPLGSSFGPRLPVRIQVTAPLPTPPPAVDQTAAPTVAPATTIPGLAIGGFAVTPAVADPGNSATLTWWTTGAITVSIYHLFPSGQLGMPYWNVAAQGSLTVTVGERERNWSGYVLFASNQNRTVQATVSIQLLCPDSWFIPSPPEICPAGPPLVSAAAEQPFELGTMIWVGNQGLIYVLFADGASPAWKTMVDRWQEGDAVSDPTLQPPQGLLQPVRGFGLAWRNEPGVRERLGWAVAAETGFETTLQATSRYKYNDLYIRALDGDIYLLLPEGSGWRMYAP